MAVKQLVEEYNQFIAVDERKLRTKEQPTMADLIKEAERAGERETEFVNDQLSAAFESWIDQQNLGEITEEEADTLRLAFEKGFGICVHNCG